jgi:hypothetical protein
MRNPRPHLFLATACLLGLSACSGGTVKETLGLDSQAPDEFRVVSRPPLSVPPQFSLRPPSVPDGSNTRATEDKARALVTGNNAPVQSGPETFVLGKSADDSTPAPAANAKITKPTAESRLLEKAGADVADPTVRRELAEEKLRKQEQVEERSWWDWMTFSSEKKEPLVDAKKEAERIQGNEREGKPVNEGDTPTVKPRDRGVLGHILGD